MFTQEMLTDVRCPVCPTESLEVLTEEKTGECIMIGALQCASCDSGYQIRGGVSDLIPGDVQADEWRLWNEHLAGFDARRKWRIEHPDRFSTRATHRSSSLQRAFAEFTEIEAGVILDIGCGPGNFRHCFDSRRVNYWGIDPLPLPESQNFPFIRAVAEHLPFRDHMFSDLVVMAAMDHFQDIEAFCEETVRVLAPDGRLHIVQSVHDVHGPLTAVRAVVHWVKDRMELGITTTICKDAPKHMTEFRRDSFRQAMDQHFQITRESKFCKRWYSPDNLFVTMVPRAR